MISSSGTAERRNPLQDLSFSFYLYANIITGLKMDLHERMMESMDPQEKDLARQLAGNDPKQRDFAWRDFLNRYGDYIYRIAFRFAQHDDEIASEVFLYIIEALVKTPTNEKTAEEAECHIRFQRYLESLDEHPESSFKTWLAQVVSNLCRDWHRMRFGRRTIPKAVWELGDAAVELFKELYWKKSGEQAAYHILEAKGLIENQTDFDTTLLLLEHSLGDVQRWSIVYGGLRRQALKSIDSDGFRSEDGDARGMDIADSYFNPEADMEKRQATEQVEIIIRLMKEIIEEKPINVQRAIGLWCEGTLKAKEIARLLGFPNAKVVYREIEKFKAALEKTILSSGLNWDSIAPAIRLLNGTLEKIINNAGKMTDKSV